MNINTNAEHVRLVTSHDDAHAEFKRLAARATRIQIAVAWATEGGPIQDCLNGSADIEAIVETSALTTAPSILWNLHTSGSLRLMHSANPLFHPKAYRFETPSGNFLFIGSHNATSSAFQSNMEASVVVRVNEQLGAEWNLAWDEWWQHASPSSDAVLADYEARFQLAQSKRPRESIGCAQGNQRGTSFASVDWAAINENPSRICHFGVEEYLSLLQLSESTWEVSGIIDEYECSYCNTIAFCGAVLRQGIPNVEGAGRADLAKIDWILGRKPSKPGIYDAGLLGRLTGAGTATNTIRTNREFQRQAKDCLDEVRGAIAWEDVVKTIQKYWKTLRRPGVAHGTLTRLLSIVRPDCCVSVNGASIEKLAQITGVNMNRMKKVDGYIDALARIQESPWCATSELEFGENDHIYRVRVALLDVFAYRPFGECERPAMT